MTADPSLTDNLLVFLQTLGAHWIALAIGAVLLVEGVFSPFRADRPPEGRRVVMLAAAAIAFIVASFQAFGDQHLAAVRALRSADSFREAMQTERDRGGSERDRLAAQLAATQKQLTEKGGVVPVVQLEDGTQQHPFSDKTKCPQGFAIVDTNQTTGSSGAAPARQPGPRDRVCFVTTKSTEASGGKNQ